jgi:predicted  nucleic acid-binding Zn-ribbon protein
MSDRGSSGIVQVVIAFITVIGSLGVAYITTGKTFESEVNQAKLRIEELQKQSAAANALAEEVREKLLKQEGQVEQRMADLKSQLDLVDQKNGEFQQLLASLKEEVESSKQNVNNTATDAINRINAARTRAMTERVP